MEDNRLFTEERRDEILNLLRESGSLSVLDLSERFRVSGTTIRTDLTALKEKGLLRRTHGGAVLPQTEMPFYRELGIQERTCLKEKQAIAKAALAYVSSHETILLDNGTTMAAFCTALLHSSLSGLTVYSNDLNGMELLEAKENFDLRLFGGRVRSGFHYTYGPQVNEEIRKYHFAKVFLAANALSKDGLTTVNSDLAEVKRAMIDSAEEVILLADSSKIGQICFQKFADLSEIDIMITDRGISSEDKTMLEKKIGKLILV